MDKELTIVITTFNRKNRLIAQLQSIFRQKLYTGLHIVVCDNCSDYNINDALNDAFLPQQLSCVEIVQRPFNIGMIGNISHAFLYPKTKWMWLLSDDDQTSADSISTIFKYLALYPDTAAFKFTEISSLTKRDYREHDVKSLHQMFEFCQLNKVDLGNFIFMSNNIYNMHALKPYLGSAFVHSYTYFPHMIPVLMVLNSGEELRFISESIVTYQNPDVAASSNYLVSIYLGAMSISDIPFNISDQDFESLCNFFKMNVFWEISNDFYNSSYLHKRYLYRKIYKSLFGNKWSLKNMLIYRIFDFQMRVGNNSISKFCFKLKESVRKV